MHTKLPKKAMFGVIFLIFVIRKVMVLVVRGGVGYWQEWLSVVWFVLGAIIGAITLFADRLLDIYFVNPNTELAMFAKKYFAQRKNRDGILILLKNKSLQRRLFMHSALFQGIWVLLAIFGITSTNAIFGKGYILGMGLWFLLEEWEDYKKNKEYLRDWLFWQININLKDRELLYYLVGVTVVWVGLFLRVV